MIALAFGLVLATPVLVLDTAGGLAGGELAAETPAFAVVVTTPEPTPVPSPAPAAEAAPSTLVITASPLDTRRIAGSANLVGEEQLERFEHDDAHRVLAQVPGVYLRDEDGYGLRPNIGMRGASSDRSAKVTLMEDGVLLAPAPYSAPAAYYFPLMSRVTAVEVYKGPAAIKFGPNTIGGAINLLSRPVPFGQEAAIDAGAGGFGAAKLHARAGAGGATRGVSVEGLHLQTTGYKELDGGGNTGFDKNEVVTRAFLGGERFGLAHRSELKLALSTELSNETYLGLTDGDFREDPWRRYAASAKDRMEWQRTAAQWTHAFAGAGFDGALTVYRNDMSRSWRKINRFAGAELANVLAHPDAGQSAVYAAILRGEVDSSSPDETIMIGTNSREFVSQGVQLRTTTRFDTGRVTHALETGVRLHGDRIDRFHTEDPHLMQSGALVDAGAERLLNVDSRASALAVAIHAVDELRLGRVLLTPGARFEWIETATRDRLSGGRTRSTDMVVLPGLGLFVDAGHGLGLLAGAHQGFSPVAPGQPPEVDPELSMNYEAGARWSGVDARAEVIGFFSDYTNLTGECTFSGGCSDELNAQFEGRAVNVWGLEAVAGHSIRAPRGIVLGGEASWTWTETMFLTDFYSANPQWGDVEAGDELPYVPRHRIAATVSAGTDGWELALAVAHVSAMREEAGRGPIRGAVATDEHTVVDAAARWRFAGRGELYAAVENVLGEEYLVSHRPFGARPGKRRDFRLGFKYRFGG